MIRDTILRVLMVAPQFRPLVGGYERAAERLAGGLAAGGHDVAVVTERRDRAWPATERLAGFTILRLPCLYHPGLHVVTAALSLFCYLVTKGRRYQIFHVHQYGFSAAAAVVAGKLVRRPVILKLTSTGPQGPVRTLRRSRMATLLVALHRSVDCCVATTDLGVEEALQLGIPAERVQVVPNPVDTDRFRPLPSKEKQALQRELGLTGSGVVLYVGRLSQEKNPLGLLEAWAEVVRECPGCRLAMVGHGPQEPQVRRFVTDHGLESSVVLAGYQADPLLWYQAADLYVLPSLNEGLSNSLLEALSCALPTAATEVSGVVDIFRQAQVGVIVPVGRTSALRDGLIDLLRNPERRREYGLRARGVVIDQYAIGSVIARFEALYRSLLGRSAAE